MHRKAKWLPEKDVTLIKSLVHLFLGITICIIGFANPIYGQDYANPDSFPRQHSDAPGGYVYYAHEDKYDARVAGGYLLLKAGHSYLIGGVVQEQIEVQLTATGLTIGYALIIPSYDEWGRFQGWEDPIAFIDTNGDSLVSVNELGLASKEVISLSSSLGMKPEFESRMGGVYSMIGTGNIADAYLKIKASVSDISNARKEHRKTIITIITIVAFVTLLCGVIILYSKTLARSRKLQGAVSQTTEPRNITSEFEDTQQIGPQKLTWRCSCGEVNMRSSVECRICGRARDIMKE
jgi:hypothetical protein